MHGATYALPTGQRVVAEKAPKAIVWLLRGPGHRTYTVGRDGVSLQLVGFRDEQGVYQSGRGPDGGGQPTGWTLADLTLVDPTAEANCATVQRFIDQVWNAGDAAALQAFLTPDFADQSPGQRPDQEGLSDLLEMMQTAFPDLRFSVDVLFAQGDKVVVRWTARGTHRRLVFLGVPPRGTEVAVTGTSIFDVAADQIVEVWSVWDRLGLLLQLGVIPAGGRPTR